MTAKPANSLNLSAASGICTWDGTSVQSTVAMTQYDVLTGGASANAINQVTPSATSGVPLISKGSSTQPAFGTAVVAGGGTGAATFTAYALITAGTTATGAFQNVSGVGSAGNILRSAGASALPAWTTTTYPATNAINTLLYASAANVMSALATADNGVLITSASGVPSILADGTTGQILTATTGSPPAWAAPATPSGSLVLIQKQTAATSSSLAFTTGITNTYDQYILRWYGVTVSGTEIVLQLQYSTNGGTSYDSTAANYNDNGFLSTQAALFQNNSTSYAGVPLTTYANTSSSFYAGGELRMDLLASSGFNHAAYRSGYEYQTTAGFWTYEGSANIYSGSTSAINAFQIIPSSGTFSGTFKLYGIVN